MPSPAKLLASASGASVDPNFRNVTLLLHGDGSNGAQNNTFIDSSTNNFTITRNGNPTQGSFSPYGSRWSNYFDGNGDYLTTTYTTSSFDWWSLGVDFTIEAWVYATDLSKWQYVFNSDTNPVMVGNASATSSVNYWSFGPLANGTVGFKYYNGSISVLVTSSATINANTWNHIAMTKTSSGITIFVNGTPGTTSAITGTPQSSTSYPLIIGQINNACASGYVSDLRIVRGTAVYTGSFTPPTTPLTAITNTSLLTCQSNRFRDASTNNFAITRNGDVRVSPFSPYAPTAPYSAAANGGSMYFDGSGDFLTTPSNAAFAFGTGDFTIECWAYRGNSDYLGIFESRGGGTGLLLYIDAVNQYLRLYDQATASHPSSTLTVPVGSWVHLAATRSSGTLYFWINGQAAGSTSYTTNLGSSATLRLGATNDGAVFLGNLADLRVVKGTAVYTASFTPPSAPVTAISGTSLLLNGTNAAIFDSAADNDLETVGNAQISTSVKKFGTGSMAFDGSGDYLVAPSSTAFDLGSGDFTIECWFNANSFAAPFGLISRYAVTAGVSAYGWLIQVRSSTSIRLLRGNDLYFDSTVSTMSTGTWYHVAAVRNGSTFTLYLNGTQVGQATGVSNFTDASSTTLQIGRTHTVTDDMNGYIDDIRITKGVARYTANFTPPTAAFPDQ